MVTLKTHRERVKALSPEERTRLVALGRRKALEKAAGESIPRTDNRTTYTPSFVQKRLWFINSLTPESPAYNLSTAVLMSGELNIQAVNRAMNEIVRRHETLRTRFVCPEGQLIALIDPPPTFCISVVDLREMQEGNRQAQVEQAINDDNRRPFNLSEGPLWRIRLLQLSDIQYVCQLTMHHIISDGWSMTILIRELGALYEAYAQAKESPLEELPCHYSDYAEWQQRRLRGEALEAELEYWRRQLGGALPVLELPIDRVQPSEISYRGATYLWNLSLDLSRALEQLSLKNNVTLFMTLSAAFMTQLFRYNGQTDIVIGTTVAGRQCSETEGLIGCFLNTLVLRADLAGAPTFRELIGKVRETAIGAYSNQNLPFEKLVEELQPERDLDRTPIFQVMFVLQNAPMEKLQLPGLTLTSLPAESGTVRFDLALLLINQEDGLHTRFEYKTDLFTEAQIQGIAQRFDTLLRGVVVDPDLPITRLALLSESERRQLSDWSRSGELQDADLCVRQWFEAQAAQTPDAVAMVFEEELISYGELNARANRLAHYLQFHNVKPEAPVGLCFERSSDMIVAILGVLKSGGGYLPLDPGYPKGRLAVMLTDSQLSLLLTSQSLIERLPQHQARVICLDAEWSLIGAQSGDNPIGGGATQSLAYIIYTSGSTGSPKGVVVERRNLARSTQSRMAYYTEPANRFLLLSSFAFDSSVAGIFGTLCSGGTLVLISEFAQKDVAQIAEVICSRRISRMLCLPSLYSLLLEGYSEKHLDSLRNVVVAGEECSKEVIERHDRLLPGAVLTNEYGPTEGTVWATAYDCVRLTRKRVPIGRPILGVQVHIVDHGGDLTPIGFIGELYIGGEGVARGYLGRPDLTAALFLPDSHESDSYRRPGARLYRTGDQGHYLQDGLIEFLGRVDHQVKIRGFRVELSEIEAVLSRHPKVRKALVLPREDRGDEKRLVAYVAPHPGPVPSSSELREYLKLQLPDYMAPAGYVMLDEFPLTENGKLDRRALLALDPGRPNLNGAFIAPRGAVEELLAGIWSGVLGIERVGVHDNFFELGGHSLLATQVTARIRESVGVELPLRLIFEEPTVAQLAGRLSHSISGKDLSPLPPLKPRSEPAYAPLTFAQQRLWFIDQLAPGNRAYNVPVALRLEGRLRIDLLEKSLSEICRRHEALRTTFSIIDGKPCQEIHRAEALAPPLIDLCEIGDFERREYARLLAAQVSTHAFDLTEYPLFRLLLLRIRPLEHILLFSTHHINSDGWSMGVLVREMTLLYTAYLNGKESPLYELPIQYADYAAWQREWLQGEVLERQKSYWLDQFKGGVPALNLPTDRPRPMIQGFRGARTFRRISPDLTKAVKQLSRQEGCTLFMTLLAAFGTLLSRYSSQDDVVIGTPIANRTQVEVENLIGLFANTLAIRIRPSSSTTYCELLGQAREATLGAYCHQDLPFELLVEQLRIERDLSRHPLFQVMFVFQNMPQEELQLPGLKLSLLTADSASAKFDLWLSIEESDDDLSAALEYDTELFDGETIERLLGHYCALLESVTGNPKQRLGQVQILTDPERRQISSWNDTGRGYPAHSLTHEIIENQAAKVGDSIAVVAGSRRLSYAALNRRSNQLAHYLRRRGLGTESKVGVCFERSLEQVVGLFGVMKAGCAYTPIDPDNPADRIVFLVENAGVSLLLTQTHLAERVSGSGVEVISLDSDWAMLSIESEENPVGTTVAENQAYVIYTSGSTGRPKGVMSTHGGLLNRLQWMQEAFPITEADCVLQKTPFTFDVSVWEFFWPLMNGARLALAQPDGHRDSQYLIDVIASEKVTTVHFVPSMLQIFLNGLSDRGLSSGLDLSSLRQVICSGEALPAGLKNRFQSQMQAELHNLYGPTEASIDVTWWPCEREETLRSVPIGKPIANTIVYILDEQFNLCPVGVTGQLHIGGVCLARGYLGDPALTAEKFAPNPLCDQRFERLYRTGDLARYMQNGNIEYLGRLDNQVKLRGLRIELGEIESVLGQHPSVRESAVTPWEFGEGDTRLVAYVRVVRDGLRDDKTPIADEFTRVSQWQSVWNETYSLPGQSADAEFNTVGWNSSYDGRPIPSEEMREWLESTVERILELRPGSVIEIGCGAGLLLYRIAPHCSSYVGTDFSPEALNSIQQRLRISEIDSSKVSLIEMSADDFSQIEPGSVDTVILNSVIQYFPGIEYLMRVLEGALGALRPGGRIFIGDVRSLPLLEAFCASTQFYQGSASLSRQELRERVRRQMAAERELVVDPAFFSAIQEKLPQISRSEIRLKRGIHQTEMNCFRYDVTLRIGDETQAYDDDDFVEWRVWESRSKSFAELHSLLATTPQQVVLRRAPNARVERALKIVQWIANKDGPDNVGGFRDLLERTESNGVEPEEFYEIGSRYGYRVDLQAPGSGADGCYDVVLRRNPRCAATILDRRPERLGAVTKPWNEFGNNPMYAERQKLAPILRRFLEERLPRYMAPNHIVLVDQIPLTPNGKVDRKALPPPELGLAGRESHFIAPETELEGKLAAIWAEVLGLERIGRRDNFFEIGGDSILSVQIIARARQAGIRLSPHQIFQYQTVAELAAVADTTPGIVADQGVVTGPIRLTPIQRWFLEQDLAELERWNQALLLKTEVGVGGYVWRSAVQSLYDHHDALRMELRCEDGQWQAFNGPLGTVPFLEVDLTQVKSARQKELIEDTANRLQRAVGFSGGRMAQGAYFDCGAGAQGRLLLIIHHLVVDGVSWRILLEDLEDAARQAKRGQRVELAPKTTSFKQWSEYLWEYARSGKLQSEAHYWLERALDDAQMLTSDLPLDRNTENSAQRIESTLSEEETTALLRQVPEVYHTQINDALLTALAQALVEWSGQSKVLVDLEGHGREELFPGVDLTRTVGWFTTVYPILLGPYAPGSPGEMLKQMKEQLRAIPSRGIGFGLLLYYSPNDQIRMRLRQQADAQVMFNYLGQLDTVLPASSWVRPAGESSGEQRSPHARRRYLLEVNSSVRQGRLVTSWSYSAELHQRETIERLAGLFTARLSDLILFCLSPEAGGYTPSDFPMAGLSQSELDALLAQVEN